MAKNGTVAYIDAPKKCDFHKQDVAQTIAVKGLVDAEARALNEGVPDAEYDAKTTHGFWANMCRRCMYDHSRYGPENLGIGKGQRLELRGVDER